MDESSAIALTQLGRLEMASRNYAKAAGYLRRSQAARPNNTEDATDYARALELSGDLPRARDALLASVKLNPDQFEARLALGRVYLGLNDAKAAEDQFVAAVLLQPGSPEAQIALARAQIRQKKFADAVELLEPIANSSSNDAEIFVVLASAYTALGRRQDAQRAELHAKELRKSKQPQ